MRLRDLQCRRNPVFTPHLDGIRVFDRVPVKLPLWKESRGVATLDALKLGIKVEDHIGASISINFLQGKLCQTMSHSECTKVDHVRTYSLSIKGAYSQHGHCNYHFSLWIDTIQ
jgi:hypothetical protein